MDALDAGSTSFGPESGGASRVASRTLQDRFHPRLRVAFRAGARRSIERLADTLFPPCCLSCLGALGERPSPTLLCVVCRGRLVAIDLRSSCATCSRPLPRASGAPLRCGACLARSRELERVYAVWRYQPPISDAILALKFRRLDFLADALAELACGREPFAVESFETVVPVPLPVVRRWVRGFNQAERIAVVVARRLGLPVVAGLERPALLAEAQSRLGRAARRASERERFRVPRSEGVRGRRILLVDDVTTTGETLRAAARALNAAGAASVSGFVLAATPDRSWGPNSGPPEARPAPP